MSINVLTANRFLALFNGNLSYKGITRITSLPEENKKLEVHSYLDKTPFTTTDMLNHLNGITSVGMAPINEDGMCGFGVIDIDDYSPVIKKRLANIYRYDIPVIPFYSKSGGLHLYVFFSNPTPPEDVKNILDEIKTSIGLPLSTEVFPKQRSADKSNFASWINLPYFNAADKSNKRKLIKEDGSLACLEEAIDYCISKKITIEQLRKKLTAMPFYDAPPCIQSLYIQGVEDYRNEFLFSVAVYCKSKYGEDQFEQEVLNINATFDIPLPENEIQNTIIKTMQRKTYSYKCNTPPLCAVCNKHICSQRQYGKGSGKIPSLSFEEFHQYMAEPPYYEWIINGQALRFYKEEEIINQAVFRNQCMRLLHKLPPKLRDDKWTEIVNNALENVIVHDTAIENTMSTGSLWYKYTCDFFATRRFADNKQQIPLGRIYRDNELGLYVFRGTDYIEYIATMKNFKDYSATEMQNKLMDKGAKTITYNIGEDTVTLWALPFSAINTKQADISNIEISFLDSEEEGDKF